MADKYVPLILKFLSLGLIACAGGFWSGASMELRPKYRDEQSLISGTIWSQVIIPIGLLLTETINEDFNKFIHAYFYVASIIILFVASIFLIAQEIKKFIQRPHLNRDQRTIDPALMGAPLESEVVRSVNPTFDRTYLVIGVLFLCAAVTTTVNFAVLQY